jgi:uncharacterized membrane protein (UPF0127 family)
VKRLFIVGIAALIVILLALGALFFTQPEQSPAAPETSHVVLIGNGTVRMNVEIADTPGEWASGLMNRTSMPQDAGMIFIFGNEAPRYFWMENTLIPLDMIFIASNLTIIDIHENAVPLCEDIIASSGPCKYVLEINGGQCAESGIEVGDRVALDLN